MWVTWQLKLPIDFSAYVGGFSESLTYGKMGGLSKVAVHIILRARQVVKENYEYY